MVSGLTISIAKYRWWLMLLICSTPLVFLLFTSTQVMNDPLLLGPDPAEVLLHWLGHISMTSIIMVLFIRPFSQWFTALRWLMQFRRMFGLTAFLYVCLHGLVYVLVMQAGSWELIRIDLLERWYITLGFIAWVLLLLLAITSHYGIRRKMGVNQWRRLHRSIYFIAGLVLVHYLLQIRSDWSLFAVYLSLITLLLLARLPVRQQGRQVLLKYFSK